MFDGGSAVEARRFLVAMNIDIEQIVERVIAEKESKGKAPAQCDLHEILKAIVPGIKDEMRRLIKEGKYQGSITINKIPVLRKRTS